MPLILLLCIFLDCLSLIKCPFLVIYLHCCGSRMLYCHCIIKNQASYQFIFLLVFHEVLLLYLQLVPGPPFVFGALLVICALLVAVFIPENVGVGTSLRSSSKRQSGLWIYVLVVSLFSTKDYQYKCIMFKH